MATHILNITIEVEGHNSPERPRAGHAFINQLGHRVADGMLPRAIQKYIRASGTTISMVDENVADVKVTISISEDTGGGGGG